MKKGHLIKELRLNKGYSQRELSIKSGLSERTIQRIEKNEVAPSSYSLRVLSAVFEENLLPSKNKVKDVRFRGFIIPMDFNAFMTQVRDGKKTILISLIISFVISFCLSRFLV